MAALYGFKTRHDCTIFTKDEKKHILFKGVQMFSQAHRTTEAMLEDFFLSLKWMLLLVNTKLSVVFMRIPL